MKYLKTLLFIIPFLALSLQVSRSESQPESGEVKLVVLGIAQDAGYPQINCYKEHCLPGWKQVEKRKLATSLAVIDESNQQKFVFEATPDIREQFYRLNVLAPDKDYPLAGILLTHAHIGHYTGLMHLGKEAANTANIPVYAMPRMRCFLENNGPWSQLVSRHNILLKPLQNNKVTALNNRLSVKPLLVPHRDEYSETVGYIIYGPHKKVLFIPDIDKWKKWKTDINAVIKEVDYAFLDGTFFSGDELPGRDMSKIPHPFVIESMMRFSALSKKDRNKIYFIHFNHSNPLIWSWHKKGIAAKKFVNEKGFHIAKEGWILSL